MATEGSVRVVGGSIPAGAGLVVGPPSRTEPEQNATERGGGPRAPEHRTLCQNNALFYLLTAEGDLGVLWWS